MSALDAIKAKLAAQKAAAVGTTASNGTLQTAQAGANQPSQATGVGTGTAGAGVAGEGGGMAQVTAQPTQQDIHSTSDVRVPVLQPTEPAAPQGTDPLAGLKGIQLLLARKKLAEQAGKVGLGAAVNRSSGSHVGTVGGTGSSLATQGSQVQGMAQAVLTPAQRAMEEAKRILQNKEGLGAYSISPEAAARLPEELPADVVSERLRELDAALVLKTPDLARLTIEINRNLRQYDELAYLLKDEQLGLIVQANLTIKNTELLQTKAKGSSVAKRNEKIAASLTADDI